MNNGFSYLAPLMPVPSLRTRQTLLYGTDAQGSVVAGAGRQAVLPVYGAWGSRGTDGAPGRTGFAGEVREPRTDLYSLGSRLYSPRLRRFLSADPLSPFGDGGLNRYAYCGGDPVNRIDPTGNSWLDWLGAALGLVGAVLGTVMTAGALLPAAAAAGGLMAAMSTASGAVLATTLALDVVSLAAEVGSTVALAAGDEKTMGILGWVAFGTGMASAGMALAPRAAKAAARAGRFVGSWQDRLQHAGGVPGRVRRTQVSEIALQDIDIPSNRTLVGFHGTSDAHADRIIRGGFEGKLFLTDSYLNAYHYAEAAATRGNSSAVVLSASVNNSDLSKIKASNVKASNTSFFPEAAIDKNSARMINFEAESNRDRVMEDFFDFWKSREAGLLAEADMSHLLRMHQEAIDRGNRRSGWRGLLCFFRQS